MTEVTVVLCTGLVIATCSHSDVWRPVGVVVAVVSACVMVTTAALGAALSAVAGWVQ